MPGGNALKRRTRVPNGFDRAGCKFAKSVKIFPRERSDSKKRFFPQPVNSCPDTKRSATLAASSLEVLTLYVPGESSLSPIPGPGIYLERALPVGHLRRPRVSL